VTLTAPSSWHWGRLLVEPRRPQAIRGRGDAHWFAVAAVCVGALMGQLDASIVTVALPSLSRSFHASVGSVTWVGLAYLVTLVATVTAVGRFADMFGRKLLYIYGFLIFIAASALCGLAPDLAALVGFRALQGLGAAMLQANSLAIIVLVVPARALGRALGLQAAAQAIGLALGPTVGGVLLAAGGWRLIFLVNVPLGLFGAAAALALVPRSQNLQARAPFDWLGLGLFFPGVVGLLSALSFGATAGWGSPLVLALLTTAAALGVAFWAVERRSGRGDDGTRHRRRGDRTRQRRRVGPMLDLALFRITHFATGIVSGLGAYLVLFGVLLLIPFYLERGLGLGAARSGLELMALPLAFGLAASLAGRWVDRVGPRSLTTGGMALAATSLLLLGLIRPGSGTLLVLLVLLGGVGAGLGLFTSPNNAAIMGAVPPQQAGVASGVLNMSRGLGTALGLAVTGLVFTVTGGATAPHVAAAAHVASAVVNHAFSVTAFVLAGIALGSGCLAALRANGALGDARLAAIE
jgi:MFS family permease